MINPIELTGKHILITGGSSGIGRACAVQASRLGAKVTMISRSKEKMQETISLMEHPEEQAAYPFDLNRIDEIEALVKKIVEERGTIDGFCHAAGIGTPRTLKTSKPAYMEKMLKIHLCAFVELVRSLAAKNHLSDGASLIGISSVAGEKGNASQEVYGAAKAGMNGFVHPAAQGLQARRIRINTVAYAMVDTDMYRDFLDSGGNPAIMKKQYLGVIDPESAANVVAFLLSDACPYITGSVLPVYAGC